MDEPDWKQLEMQRQGLINTIHDLLMVGIIVIAPLAMAILGGFGAPLLVIGVGGLSIMFGCGLIGHWLNAQPPLWPVPSTLPAWPHDADPTVRLDTQPITPWQPYDSNTTQPIDPEADIPTVIIDYPPTEPERGRGSIKLPPWYG